MPKFTVIRIAENGQGRLLRISQHTSSLLAGKRAWCWMASSTNPDTGSEWADDDIFELPDGSFQYVDKQIPDPEDAESTVTITELVPA
jgi:hypothetical protein